MAFRFLAAMLSLAVLTPGTSATAQTVSVEDGQDRAVQALAAELVNAALAVPLGSSAKVYAAQFALTIDRSKLDCPQILEAVALARSSPKLGPVARKGLDIVRGSLAVCRRGTGAGPAGPGDSPKDPLPDFSPGGGGGSDYTP